jgi:ribosomal protein S18 acetylase RimI-like enzyme
VNVCDWRDAAPDVVAPLYQLAQRRWLRELGWDTSAACDEIERARTTWGLPGLLAVDDAGQVRGWAYFYPSEGTLQVGGLAADTPLATRALLDALVQLSNAEGIDRVSCFVFDEAPELCGELDRRGFRSEHFLYLTRDLDRSPSGVERPRIDRWNTGDVAGVAALLREAYDAADAIHFAPGHTTAAWEHYVGNIVGQTGLGRFDQDATCIVRAGGHLDAAALMTTLSSNTAHLAQVAVHPSRRREGLAASLVEEACSRAARAGRRRITLLVAASNVPARRLYDALGFTPCATFVAASIEGASRTALR